MKRQLLILAAMLFLGGAAMAQTEDAIYGNGNKVKDKRPISNFSELYVQGPFEVTLTDNIGDYVTLEGSENIVKLITVNVKDGKLEISLPKDLKYKAHKNNKVNIKVPQYNSLHTVALNGSGNITARSTINTNIKVKLEGSGSINLNLYSGQGEACLLGSGSIILKGAVQDFSCKVIGSGTILAETLECNNVDAVVSGSGNAKVTSNKAIKGKISGSGNIAFSGDPSQQELKRTGSGEYIKY